MDEYADIYYVDNARNASNDHRTGGVVPTSIFTPFGNRPMPTPVGAVPPPVPARTVYVQPASQPAVTYGQPYVQPYVYTQPAPQASPFSSLFGNLHAGQVIAMVAEALAAFRSLPAAPVATRDVPTDVANGITYDTALAQHAKTDEQIRTIGHLVGRLVR